MAATRRRRTADRTYPRRGEIYLTAFDPTVGREIKKTRPALIIQNDVFNRFSGTTIVAPLTSKIRFPLSPVHALLLTEHGLVQPSAALLDQIRTVDRKRLIRLLGTADQRAMNQVDQALQISLGIDESRRT